MVGKPRECDKGCGEVIAWDDTEREGRGGFVEVNGNNQFHSKARCESLGGVWPPMQAKPFARDTVKSAVNQDITMAILQKLDAVHKDVKRILGEESQE